MWTSEWWSTHILAHGNLLAIFQVNAGYVIASFSDSQHNKRHHCYVEKLQQRRRLTMKRCLLAVQLTTSLSVTHSRLAVLMPMSSRKRWTSLECLTKCRTLLVEILFLCFCIAVIIILSQFNQMLNLLNQAVIYSGFMFWLM